MPQHIEQVVPSDKPYGRVSYRIWYDDPEHEDPSYGETGFSVPCNYSAPAIAVQKVIDKALIPEAIKVLPPDTVFEIRGKRKPDAEGTAREWGMAWYHLPRDHASPCLLPLFRLTDHKEAEDEPLGGYMILARLRTPKRTD